MYIFRKYIISSVILLRKKYDFKQLFDLFDLRLYYS